LLPDLERRAVFCLKDMRAISLSPIMLALLGLACAGDDNSTGPVTTQVTTESSATIPTSSEAGETAGQTTDPPADPSWSECFGPFGSQDYATCAAACAAEGRLCRAGGCDGATVEGFTFHNCSASQQAVYSGCADDITVIGNAFRCCCL
jgi:hypothetical protein